MGPDAVEDAQEHRLRRTNKGYVAPFRSFETAHNPLVRVAGECPAFAESDYEVVHWGDRVPSILWRIGDGAVMLRRERGPSRKTGCDDLRGGN
jgi:hypothetical protein